MEKKKVQFKKDKKFYFSLFIISIALIGSIAFITSNKVLKGNKTETTIEDQPKLSALDIQECPYTLDEIYEFVKNYQWEHRLASAKEDMDDKELKMLYVILHFYDYFNKDTKFMVAREIENGKVLTSKYISYSDYQKAMIDIDEMFGLSNNNISKKNEDYYQAAVELISFYYIENWNGVILTN